MTHILVVEDEPAIAFAIEADLQTEGYGTTLVTDGDEALGKILDQRNGTSKHDVFDLILLDVMLPGKDGFDICRAVRRAGIKTPIIVLTAKAQEAEKVMGLEMGADDYVTKPFSPRELRARIKAHLRRGEPQEEIFVFGDVTVDFSRCEVRRQNRTVDLSALEFKLLVAFIRSGGRVLSRDQLLDAVWGQDVSLNDRVVDNHIVNLRRKLELKPAQPKHFLNIRGMGYRFDA